MVMCNKVCVNIVPKWYELQLVSKYITKVHWEFLKGKGGCSLQVQGSLGTYKRWLLVTGSALRRFKLM